MLIIQHSTVQVLSLTNKNKFSLSILLPAAWIVKREHLFTSHLVIHAESS